jgi:hypothetical protein
MMFRFQKQYIFDCECCRLVCFSVISSGKILPVNVATIPSVAITFKEGRDHAAQL